jgi:hypothetical protein
MENCSWKVLVSTTPTSSCKLSNEIKRPYLFKLLNITDLMPGAEERCLNSIADVAPDPDFDSREGVWVLSPAHSPDSGGMETNKYCSVDAYLLHLLG